ncbi:hypothetical protein M758_5G073800 [Ceratodon purpureus]|nr:hypothetical protein M758_5G073800 [Ceratodon purpureus]
MAKEKQFGPRQMFTVYGEVYHCEICHFDAHVDCAKIMDKVEVSFHDHPLHLLIQNYYDDNFDATCNFCKELVQGSEWVYRCEQCNFNLHAFCTKYPVEMNSTGVHAHHEHSLTLAQSPPDKSLFCTCCNGNLNGYLYTCVQKWCAFELHPCCTLLSLDPPCVFDSWHRLSLICKSRAFHCGKCSELGFSWFYHCAHCDVDIHLNCSEDKEEEHDWNGAYEKYILEYETKDAYNKMVMINELLEKLLVNDTLEASLSSRTTPPPVTIRVQPPIQRLKPTEKLSLDTVDEINLHKRIAADRFGRWQRRKKIAAKEARQKLKVKSLEMIGSLEKIVLELHSSKTISQADAEVLAATHKKLKIVQKQKTSQDLQLKIRQGPRLGLFFKRGICTRPIQLLTNLQAKMKAVCLVLLCEEPGHEHVVHSAQKGIQFHGVLGEHMEKLQPLLASGLQVVRRAMSKVEPQLIRLSSVTLPTLGEESWDLRAIELDNHDREIRESFEEDVNMQSLKRAEDSAAQWLLSNLVHNGVSIFELFGLLRITYTATEESSCPRYTRGTVAWLCSDHRDNGLERGILEPYPVQRYHNLEYDQHHQVL